MAVCSGVPHQFSSWQHIWFTCWALLLTVLPEPVLAGGPAILQLVPADGSKPRHFNGLLAEWSTPEDVVAGTPLLRSDRDPSGCSRHRWCGGCALFVQQGNCSFSLKAQRAQQAGASLLIVASANEGPPVGMAATPRRNVWFAPQEPSITAVMVSKTTGRQVLLALDSSQLLTVQCWRHHQQAFGDLMSEAVVAVLAVSLVVLGAWHSVEDIRRPDSVNKFSEEVFAVEESSGLMFVFFGSFMLTVLFFFMKYLIYVLLFLFAAGAVSRTSALLEPVISKFWPSLREHKAFSLPKCAANIFGTVEDHTWADALSEAAGIALAAAFLVYRNNDTFGWMLQDVIAIMLLLTIQRATRLPNLKVGTLLLVCTFFFDIFWVFLSPLLFKKSVMIEVATGGGTGQSVPMVLKIPSLDLPGQFKILGLGDIAIPGLLISLLLRHDLVKRAPRCSGYFTAGVIGYALGLVATFISLYLMKHGQPALLFLVPGTLLPTFLIAYCKGELGELWRADYGPENPPEGYDKLTEGADKQA